MAFGSPWGPHEETIQTAGDLSATWSAKYFMRGVPSVTKQNTDGSAFPTHVYQDTLLGLSSYDATRKRIRVYGQDHSVVHYNTDGTTIAHARHASGWTSHSTDIYHGSGGGVHATALTPVFPYWHIKHNGTPPLGATQPHEEGWINTTSQVGGDEQLVYWHGLDSHGLAFLDGRHIQFNEYAINLPGGASLSWATDGSSFTIHVSAGDFVFSGSTVTLPGGGVLPGAGLSPLFLDGVIPLTPAELDDGSDWAYPD